MTLQIIISIVNVVLAAYCVFIAYKANKARDIALEYLIQAEAEYDNADEAKETAKVLLKFIQELRRCKNDDDYADTILKWLPILQEHGIDIQYDL